MLDGENNSSCHPEEGSKIEETGTQVRHQDPDWSPEGRASPDFPGQCAQNWEWPRNFSKVGGNWQIMDFHLWSALKVCRHAVDSCRGTTPDQGTARKVQKENNVDPLFWLSWTPLVLFSWRWDSGFGHLHWVSETALWGNPQKATRTVERQELHSTPRQRLSTHLPSNCWLPLPGWHGWKSVAPPTVQSRSVAMWFLGIPHPEITHQGPQIWESWRCQNNCPAHPQGNPTVWVPGLLRQAPPALQKVCPSRRKLLWRTRQKGPRPSRVNPRTQRNFCCDLHDSSWSHRQHRMKLTLFLLVLLMKNSFLNVLHVFLWKYSSLALFPKICLLLAPKSRTPSQKNGILKDKPRTVHRSHLDDEFCSIWAKLVQTKHSRSQRSTVFLGFWTLPPKKRATRWSCLTEWEKELLKLTFANPGSGVFSNCGQRHKFEGPEEVLVIHDVVKVRSGQHHVSMVPVSRRGLPTQLAFLYNPPNTWPEMPIQRTWPIGKTLSATRWNARCWCSPCARQI